MEKPFDTLGGVSTAEPCYGSSCMGGANERLLLLSRKNYSVRGGMGSAGRGNRRRAVPTLTVMEYSGLGSLWQKSRGRCGGFDYRGLRPRTRLIVVETRSYLVQYCIVSTPRSGCDAGAHPLSGLLPKAARSLPNGGLGSAWEKT